MNEHWSIRITSLVGTYHVTINKIHDEPQADGLRTQTLYELETWALPLEGDAALSQALFEILNFLGEVRESRRA